MLSNIQVLDRIGSPRVLVVGDLILDHYVEGRTERVSPEAPVLVFQSGFSSHRLGGACNVAANVVSAGGKATCLGLVGEDVRAQQLSDLLAEAGIGTEGLVVDNSRPTTVKTRFVSGTHQVLRVDDESKAHASEDARKGLEGYLDVHLAEFDAVILSDYGKGVLVPDLIGKVTRMARAQGIPCLVDPKGLDFSKYRHATLITPNKAEAEGAAGRSIETPEDLREVATGLMEAADLESIVITLGPEGIFFKTRGGQQLILPTEARSVYDVTGAGDTVVAFLALSLGGGLELEEAVRLANLAAGIVVGRFGTANVTRQELKGAMGMIKPGKILDEASLPQALVHLRSDKKRITFTNGCFDILHPGHLDYLEKARSYGDVLIVGVNSDESIQRLKGPERPICSLDVRLAMLAGLEVVDFLVPFDEDTPLQLIERVTPDVLAKGEDWRDKGVVGREWVESHGGQVVLVPFLEGFSTTSLIDRIRKLH